MTREKRKAQQAELKVGNHSRSSDPIAGPLTPVLGQTSDRCLFAHGERDHHRRPARQGVHPGRADRGRPRDRHPRAGAPAGRDPGGVGYPVVHPDKEWENWLRPRFASCDAQALPQPETPGTRSAKARLQAHTRRWCHWQPRCCSPGGVQRLSLPRQYPPDSNERQPGSGQRRARFACLSSSLIPSHSRDRQRTQVSPLHASRP